MKSEAARATLLNQSSFLSLFRFHDLLNLKGSLQLLALKELVWREAFA